MHGTENDFRSARRRNASVKPRWQLTLVVTFNFFLEIFRFWLLALNFLISHPEEEASLDIDSLLDSEPSTNFCISNLLARGLVLAPLETGSFIFNISEDFLRPSFSSFSWATWLVKDWLKAINLYRERAVLPYFPHRNLLLPKRPQVPEWACGRELVLKRIVAPPTLWLLWLSPGSPLRAGWPWRSGFSQEHWSSRGLWPRWPGIYFLSYLSE